MTVCIRTYFSDTEIMCFQVAPEPKSIIKFYQIRETNARRILFFFFDF